MVEATAGAAEVMVGMAAVMAGVPGLLGGLLLGSALAYPYYGYGYGYPGYGYGYPGYGYGYPGYYGYRYPCDGYGIEAMATAITELTMRSGESSIRYRRWVIFDLRLHEQQIIPEATPIILTIDERAELESLVRSRSQRSDSARPRKRRNG